MAKNITRRDFLHSSLTGAVVLGTGLAGLGAVQCESPADNIYPATSRMYFIDSEEGHDTNDGLSPGMAWKSLGRVKKAALGPGDIIRFRRGSSFDQPLNIYASGKPGAPIVLTDYGAKDLPAPAFTSQVFDPSRELYGNCIRLKGSHIIVENLYFHHTVAELPEDAGRFLVMWELGAVYIDKEAEHCIVRNNEIYDCGVGIKSYGKYARIEHNYIHDCNRVLKKWGWGPLGIWLGGDHQEVCYNTVINYSAVDSRINWGPGSYGGGADGGAIEIDDGRFEKFNIHIHHNYTKDCQGFIEVTWTDVVQHPAYRNFRIHHNVCDDYQQFIALWQGAECLIENNTIIRRKTNATDWGVFNITQSDSRNIIRNNIVVVEKGIEIFLLGRDGNARPNTIIENNLCFAADGDLNIGLDGPGESAIIADPMFRNYHGESGASDFALTAESPAIGKGLNLGYREDFAGVSIPQGNHPDIGAFEFPGEV
jgi:hypothetical protein